MRILEEYAETDYSQEDNVDRCKHILSFLGYWLHETCGHEVVKRDILGIAVLRAAATGQEVSLEYGVDGHKETRLEELW